MKKKFTFLLCLVLLSINLSAQTLVASYPFNGNANDATGNGHNGTVNGATLTTDRFGNANSAYLFNGTNNNIIVPDAPNLRPAGAYTINAWVQPKGFYSGTCQGNVIVNKGNYLAQDAYVLGYGDNLLDGGNCAGFEPNLETFFLTYDQGGAEQDSYSPDIVQLDKWYMVTGVYDGTNIKTYVNGHLQGSNPAINVAGAANTSDIYIGGYVNSGSPYWLNGKIDDISIYNGALSDAQIFDTYVNDMKKPGSGNGILFDNTKGQYIDIGAGFDPLGSFSFETWIKRKSTDITDPNNQVFIVSVNDNGWGIGINFRSPLNTIFLTKVNVSAAYSSFTINDTLWHHVAVTFDATAHLAQFYLDGVADVEGAVSYNPGGFNSGNGDYRLGARTASGSPNNSFFNGILDETRIWHTVLTATQIRDWMCKKITSSHPAFDSLFAYYHFDEGADTIAYSTGGHPGVLINSPTWVTSGASIGDASAYDYINATKTASLTASIGEKFTATNTAGNPDGIQIYRVDTIPNTTNGANSGPNNKYFGVFQVNGASPTYTAVYNYNGNPLVTKESALRLFKRADNSVTTWTDAMATLNTGSKTLTATGQSTEYILGVVSGTLPVSLINFSGYKINAAVQLTWQSENEINFSGYEIERSSDGLSFTLVGKINAQHASGINSYSFADDNPVTGNDFYRLKQINSDGNFTYSKIVKIDFTKNIIIKITPNPVQQYLNINSSTSIKELRLISLNGTLINSWTNVAATSKLDVSGVATGVYILRIITADEVVSQKIMKE